MIYLRIFGIFYVYEFLTLTGIMLLTFQFPQRDFRDIYCRKVWLFSKVITWLRQFIGILLSHYSRLLSNQIVFIIIPSIIFHLSNYILIKLKFLNFFLGIWNFKSYNWLFKFTWINYNLTVQDEHGPFDAYVLGSIITAQL